MRVLLSPGRKIFAQVFKVNKISVKVNKSAVTSKFVSNAQVKQSPNTTYVQTVKKSK
jgi:hypothetical protein